jgi:energy-coupling factor transporter ATP-binding protein EcfA2
VPALRTRPLRTTIVDDELYVDRSTDLTTLKSAIHYGFNVLLVGPRGSGKSTLLNYLARELEQEGRHGELVSAGRFASAAEALNGIAAALAEPDPDNRVEGRPVEELERAYQRLAQAAAAVTDRPLLLIDGLAPSIAQQLFGRLRDELWSLELQWLVTTDSDTRAVVLTPPADAFFETVVELTPLDPGEIELLLARRDPDQELAPAVRAAIARRGDGNPARALALARQALMARDPLEELQRGSIVERIEAQLGEPPARLADDLARNGSGGPSDPDLLRRLGWSRARAYQVFQALEGAGYLESAPERNGSAGRPRVTYRLKDLV